ncbi:hypothetical protein [Desulfovibrio sp. MES5]|uniref:hypothetical protein n=1 Tax=Desulfovibrio sp. MES5 TaxID=1899016 RepID=UPI0025C60032|nr:hypothetical protein [Desulfovibrio sp. MES5]
MTLQTPGLRIGGFASSRQGLPEPAGHCDVFVLGWTGHGMKSMLALLAAAY